LAVVIEITAIVFQICHDRCGSISQGGRAGNEVQYLRHLKNITDPPIYRLRISIMATSITSGSLIHLAASADALPKQRENLRTFRPRKISREAGRALEMLGHAIDYLADEFALECMECKGTSGIHPRQEAIELLMAYNREIYLACPEIPALGDRLRAWLGRWQRA